MNGENIDGRGRWRLGVERSTKDISYAVNAVAMNNASIFSAIAMAVNYGYMVFNTMSTWLGAVLGGFSAIALELGGMMLIGIAIKEKAHVWKLLAAGYVVAHVVAVVALEWVAHSQNGEISALTPVSVILVITSVMTHSVKGYYENLEEEQRKAAADVKRQEEDEEKERRDQDAKAQREKEQAQREKEQAQRDQEAEDARQAELRLAQIEVDKAARLAQIEVDRVARQAEIEARDRELQLRNKRKQNAAGGAKKGAGAMQMQTATAPVSANAVQMHSANGNGAVKKYTLASLPQAGREDILHLSPEEFVQKWGASERSFFNWRPKIAQDVFNDMSGDALIALANEPRESLGIKVGEAVHELWVSWVQEMGEVA